MICSSCEVLQYVGVMGDATPPHRHIPSAPDPPHRHTTNLVVRYAEIYTPLHIIHLWPWGCCLSFPS